MFDKGTFAIANDLTLIGDAEGALIAHTKHCINSENLEYHRKTHGYD